MPRFFTHRVGGKNSREFQNWNFLTEWSRFYSVLSLTKIDKCMIWTLTWFLSCEWGPVDPLEVLENAEDRIGKSTRVPCSRPCLISTTRDGLWYRYRVEPDATKKAKNKNRQSLTLDPMQIVIISRFDNQNDVFFFSKRPIFLSFFSWAVGLQRPFSGNL